MKNNIIHTIGVVSFSFMLILSCSREPAKGNIQASIDEVIVITSPIIIDDHMNKYTTVKFSSLPDSIRDLWAKMKQNDQKRSEKWIEYENAHEEEADIPEAEVKLMHEEYLELGATIYNYLLPKYGYKPVSETRFNEIIKAKFNINLQSITSNDCILVEKDYCIYYMMGVIDGANMDTKYYPTFTYENSNDLFFLKKYNLIGEYEYFNSCVNFGSDVENIEIDNRVLHRNSFVLNDRASSLTWLINNDSIFLERMVKVFGYDRDERVNKKVLDMSYNSTYGKVGKVGGDELRNLFVKRNCEGGISIRLGLLNYIVRSTTKEDRRYLDMLKSYLENFSCHEKDRVIKWNGLSEAEIFKTSIYLGYYIEKTYQNNPSLARSINDNCFQEDLATNENLREVLKKNNYYDLEGFEELFKKELEVH